VTDLRQNSDATELRDDWATDDTTEPHEDRVADDHIGRELDAPVLRPNDAAATQTSGAWLAIAGTIAAGVSLGFGELMSGLFERVSSLVVAVGDVIVDETPGSVARVTIDLFGTAQKTMLVWGITMVALLIGALVGRASHKSWLPAAAAFALFGLIGAWAGARVPTTDGGLAWLSALVAAALGLTVFLALRRIDTGVRQRTAGVAETPNDRRRFVGVAGGATAAAAVAAMTGSSLRQRFVVDSAREEAARQLATVTGAVSDSSTPGEPAEIADEDAPGLAVGADGTLDSVDGITPHVVPNDDYYRIDTALRVPQVDPASWSMTIGGMVDNPLTLNYEDLLARDLVEMPVTLSCVSNPIGGGLVGNAVWTGVPLRELLAEAGVQPGAEQLASRSVDGWTCGFPVDVLDDPDRVALVAVAMNGEPLPTSHGFPARLVISGLYGYVSATKWLEEITLTGWDDFDGYWIPRGWSKLGPVKTQSRIDVPTSNSRLDGGVQPIAGIAWAPNTGIAKVEVQIDDEPWVEAELADDLSKHSWRQWLYADWTPTPGQHQIKVRATDDSGYTQTAERTAVAPDGATGYHTINVRL